MNEIESSGWQAWIDKQPIQPTEFGTLRVTGEVSVDPFETVLLERALQGINPEYLILELRITSSAERYANPRVVSYSQALSKDKQYSSVTILGVNGGSITSIPEVF